MECYHAAQAFVPMQVLILAGEPCKSENCEQAEPCVSFVRPEKGGVAFHTCPLIILASLQAPGRHTRSVPAGQARCRDPTEVRDCRACMCMCMCMCMLSFQMLVPVPAEGVYLATV